jgi:hypothetical protein
LGPKPHGLGICFQRAGSVHAALCCIFLGRGRQYCQEEARPPVKLKFTSISTCSIAPPCFRHPPVEKDNSKPSVFSAELLPWMVVEGIPASGNEVQSLGLACDTRGQSQLALPPCLYHVQPFFMTTGPDWPLAAPRHLPKSQLPLQAASVACCAWPDMHSF